MGCNTCRICRLGDDHDGGVGDAGGGDDDDDDILAQDHDNGHRCNVDESNSDDGPWSLGLDSGDDHVFCFSHCVVHHSNLGVYRSDGLHN